MPEEIKLIQRVAVERDQYGWWSHPDEPDFDEDYAAFKAWLVQQGLELKQWHMDSDIGEHHPYDDGECHCLGWEPECPGPEWFLLGIFDTEDGPCVSWARRKSGVTGSNHQAGNERQLSPHETQPEPTPALAPGRWIDERYQL